MGLKDIFDKQFIIGLIVIVICLLIIGKGGIWIKKNADRFNCGFFSSVVPGEEYMFCKGIAYRTSNGNIACYTELGQLWRGVLGGLLNLGLVALALFIIVFFGYLIFWVAVPWAYNSIKRLGGEVEKVPKRLKK